VLPFRRDGFEHTHGFASYFRADPVAGQHENIQIQV
jgi:hypothetical protein